MNIAFDFEFTYNYIHLANIWKKVLSSPTGLIFMFTYLTLFSLFLLVLLIVVVYMIKYKRNYLRKAAQNRELLLLKIELGNALNLQRKSFERDWELYSKTLHDEVGNSLAVLKLMVDALSRNRYESDFDLLVSMKTELDRSLYIVRNITKDVFPHSLRNQGIGFAIKELCDRLSNPKLTRINYHESGTPVRLHQDHELVLYRAVQELIGNELKHSNPWFINVKLQWSEIDLIIEVAGNGSSSSCMKEASGGMGLKSIRSSLKAIDASFFLDREKIGFKAEIVHPIYNGAYQDLHS